MSNKRKKAKLIVFLLTLLIIVFNANKINVYANSSEGDSTDEQDERTINLRTGYEKPTCEFIECTDDEIDDVEEYEGEECEENYIASSEDRDYWTKMSSKYLYNRLSDEEKKLWDELNSICIECAEGTEDCTFIETKNGCKFKDDRSYQEFMEVYLENNPQFFFISNAYGATKRGEYYYPELGVYQEFWQGSVRKAAVDQFTAKINQWVADINKYPTVVEKEKRAVEIITCNTYYDLEAPLNQSAYSMVVGGSTVCAGYTAAFTILMNAVGIDTVAVSGDAGGAHAWNVSNIHGVWYVVDTTWIDQNDYASAEDQLDYLYWGYFNRSDATISEDRVRDDWGNNCCPKALYDSGTDDWDYISPYFSKNGYKYFIVNNNENLGLLYALPIENSSGGDLMSAPDKITYNNVTYAKYNADLDQSVVNPIKKDEYTKDGFTYVINDDNTIRIVACSLKGDIVIPQEIDGHVVTNLAQQLFFGMSGITSVTLPATIKAPGQFDYVFSYCYDLKAIYVDEANPYICSLNGVLFSKDKTVLYCYPVAKPGELYVTPKQTTYLCCTAFASQKYLRTLYLPNKNVSWATYTFYNTPELEILRQEYNGEDPFSQIRIVSQNGKLICQDINGNILSGWQVINYEKYYADSNGIIQTGWQLLDGKQYYMSSVGVVQTGFQQIDENFYYFDENGVMQTGWIQDDRDWYYFSDDGKACVGWKKIGKYWYYFDEYYQMVIYDRKIDDKWYYFEPSGKMVTGWKLKDDEWYYYTSSGAKAIGWQLIGGKWYYLEEYNQEDDWYNWYDMYEGKMCTGWNRIDDKRYYFLDSGEMCVGWKKFASCWEIPGADYVPGEIWVYFKTNGLRATGWQKVNDKWYYFNSDGIMLTGVQKIGQKNYYFNQNGVMQTGWVKIDSILDEVEGNHYYENVWYYFTEDGAAATGWKKLSNKWYYFDLGGRMYTDFNEINGKTYYFGSNGEMRTGWVCIKNPNLTIQWTEDGGYQYKEESDWYYFESTGAMVVGWKKINGYWYYFGNYGDMYSDCWVDDCCLDSNGKWVK